MVYEGNCDCGAKYVGETQRNFSVRIEEHFDITKVSEPARHPDLNTRDTHSHGILSPGNTILEALFIALKIPELNEKLLAHSIHLFPIGVT